MPKYDFCFLFSGIRFSDLCIEYLPTDKSESLKKPILLNDYDFFTKALGFTGSDYFPELLDPDNYRVFVVFELLDSKKMIFTQLDQATKFFNSADKNNYFSCAYILRDNYLSDFSPLRLEPLEKTPLPIQLSAISGLGGSVSWVKTDARILTNKLTGHTVSLPNE